MNRSLILPVSFLIAQAFVASSSSLFSSPSPRASTDLICRTSRASECYPRLFQPLKHFRTVHDDQELPPGLHVRLNLQTGIKEARLNVPESDEDEYTAVAVLDDGAGAQHPLLHIVGDQAKEREPPRILMPDTANGEERQVFEKNLANLKDGAITNKAWELPPLVELEELCHSMDWGLTLAKDNIIVSHLRELILSNNENVGLRSAAALLLTTAIRNNPPALKAVSKTPQYRDTFVLLLVNELATNKNVDLLIRLTSLVSALCQSDDYLHQFIVNQGLETLLDIFNLQDGNTSHISKLQAKIANFIHDYVPLLVDIANGSHRGEEILDKNDKQGDTMSEQGEQQVTYCLGKFEKYFISHLENIYNGEAQQDQDMTYRSIYAAHAALSTYREGRGRVT